MQSYGDFQQIPRNFAKSSQTCVDNGTYFGQIAETSQKVVQTFAFYRTQREQELLRPQECLLKPE
jgi:hypothetical protein